jgi:hypothetical protein
MWLWLNYIWKDLIDALNFGDMFISWVASVLLWRKEPAVYMIQFIALLDFFVGMDIESNL